MVNRFKDMKVVRTPTDDFKVQREYDYVGFWHPKLMLKDVKVLQRYTVKSVEHGDFLGYEWEEVMASDNYPMEYYDR